MRLTSMTGYGFGEHVAGDTTYSCEVRTLNSRFLEISVRLPRHLISLETTVINHAKTQLKRGKVDIFVDAGGKGGGRDLPRLDTVVVKHYAKLLNELQNTLEQSLVTSFASLQDPTLSEFFSLDGVLISDAKRRSQGPASAAEHAAPLLAAVDTALAAVKIARANEGKALGQAMLDLVHALNSERTKAAAKLDVVMQQLQKNYVKKLETTLANLQKIAGGTLEAIPPERLLAEVAILADKADINEEMTRLATHSDEFIKLVTQDDGSGRKLDFLCQEMHRELNTMANKLVQTDIAQHTLEMKQIVERLRQQVQNIE